MLSSGLRRDHAQVRARRYSSLPRRRTSGWRAAGTVFILVAAFFVQTILFPMLGIEAVAPDFVMAAVAAIALVRGIVPATLHGAAGGILQDSFSGGLLGLNGFSKTLVAFGISRIREDPLVGPSLGVTASSLLILAGALADAVFLWGLRLLTGSPPVPAGRWVAFGLGLPFTVAAGVVIFRASTRTERSGRGSPGSGARNTHEQR